MQYNTPRDTFDIIIFLLIWWSFTLFYPQSFSRFHAPDRGCWVLKAQQLQMIVI